jgi:hypothetical protein
MTIIRRVLSESIAHIEDLSIDEFIDALKTLPSMIAQEKLDGSNLWVGIDDDGKLFTSREGKRIKSDRHFSPDSWPKIAVFNQFRAAHAALMQKQVEISKVLQPGDTVESEVLFGDQPNSVSYGTDGMSYIAFLRGVNGTLDEVANKLGASLNKQQVQAKVEIQDTQDGETLSTINQSFNFQFTVPQSIPKEKLKVPPEALKHVRELERFLNDKSNISGLTNKELMSVQLTEIPKAERAAVKKARSEILLKVQVDFKLPIKQELLDKIVRELKPALNGSQDNNNIEGIILRNANTGEQIKIVDKDNFTAINKFNQQIRSEIQSSLTSVDPDASVEARGGVAGLLKIRIADFLGNRELAKASGARKALAAVNGKTAEETIRNFAASMAGVKDYQAAKQKILAMTKETLDELKEKLISFKKNADTYAHVLKSGKEIKLSKDTIKRTLLTFAEVNKSLTELYNKIKETNSLAQLLAILYGQQAKAIYKDKDDVAESLITENKGEVDRSSYEHKDLFQLVNSYLATIYLTMLIYHEQDTIGMRILRDRKNYLMKHWSADMSPLNYWGYVIWRNTKPDVKKQLTKKVAAELFKATRHIQPSWWKFMHMDFSYNKDVKVDWADHQKTLHRLIDLTGQRTDRLNTLLDRMVEWPALSYDDKVKTISKLYLFAQQFVPRSSLFMRLRVIQNNLLLNATGRNPQMVESLLKSIVKLAEDGEGGDGGGGSTAGATSSGAISGGGGDSLATTSSAIASLPMQLGSKAQIVKRRRNKTVQNLNMKFPDPRKLPK